MRIRTGDGQMHRAILSRRHPIMGQGMPMLVLPDTREVIDAFGWTFCRIISATEHERQSLRDAGYRC